MKTAHHPKSIRDQVERLLAAFGLKDQEPKRKPPRKVTATRRRQPTPDKRR